MVDFNKFMSLGLEQCAPAGDGTQTDRQATFAGLVEKWNDQKDEIRSLSASEVRSRLACP